MKLSLKQQQSMNNLMLDWGWKVTQPSVIRPGNLLKSVTASRFLRAKFVQEVTKFRCTNLERVTYFHNRQCCAGDVGAYCTWYSMAAP